MKAVDFLCSSLSDSVAGERITRILAAALQAVEPGAAVRAALHSEGHQLIVGEHQYDLTAYRRIFLVAIGKASVPMANAIIDLLARELSGGVIITKTGHTAGWQSVPGFQLVEAGHPIPNEHSQLGATLLQERFSDLQPDDLVIALISGGGSALLAAPVSGVTLADLQNLTGALLVCGAPIQEINTLRKHLDRLKGGGLARLVYPAALVTLLLSDVVGDDLDVIASGPTIPDPTTFTDAWHILQRYHLIEHIPPAIRAYLQAGCQGRQPETPKPGAACFERLQNLVIASNRQAAGAAIQQAELEGYHPLLLTNYLQGEARQAGRFLAAIARQVHHHGTPLTRPACLVAGGETTVTLRGTGLGGRNQELALGAVTDLSGLPHTTLVALATDGGDGPTDAAGAVATGETLWRAHALGLSPAAALEQNNAYPFFDALGDLLKTGPTQTNVNDLAFLFLP